MRVVLLTSLHFTSLQWYGMVWYGIRAQLESVSSSSLRHFVFVSLAQSGEEGTRHKSQDVDVDD